MSEPEFCIFRILYLSIIDKNCPRGVVFSFAMEKANSPEENVSYYFPHGANPPDSRMSVTVNGVQTSISRRIHRTITGSSEGLASLNQFTSTQELRDFMRRLDGFFTSWTQWSLDVELAATAFESYSPPPPVNPYDGIFAHDFEAIARASNAAQAKP